MVSTVPDDPADEQDGPKSPLIGILITLCLIGLMLVLVEGGVRLRQWIRYGTATLMEDAFQVDEKIGLKVPKANFKTKRVRINSLGFRGPELDQPKPHGRFRIGFLGGSTTYCAEVSHNKFVWANLVQEGLQAKYPNIPMDFVNGAVTGFTTERSLKTLQTRLLSLQPDLIVIYHASNDMSQEARSLAKKAQLVSRPEPTSWLANHSLFWFLVEKNFQVVQTQDDTRAGKNRLDGFPENFGLWFKKRLINLIREAQQQAKMVAVITWTQQMRREHSREVNLEAAASSLYYMPFLTPDLLLDGFERYNEMIRQAATETGALLIGHESFIPGDGIHFVDAVHFSDQGSKKMAERIIRGLTASDRFQQLMATWRSN